MFGRRTSRPVGFWERREGAPEGIRSRSGFSLVEFMIAVSVGLLVIACAGALYLQTSKGFLAQLNYVDLDSQSRLALDQMSQQIRMANSLISYSATNLSLADF